MIAIISDIHGNFPALKKVMEDIQNRGIVNIISLGDIAGYYCFINECINLCRSLNVINILGNHDYYLISGKGCPRSYTANICLKYQMEHITQDNLLWLKNSKTVLDINCMSLRHGGWNDPLDEYIYDFSFDMVLNRCENLFASGHTHKQVYLRDGEKQYFNPGSVGQPRDFDARAAYAIVDEKMNVELVRVEYNIEEVVNKMRVCGFDDRISVCLLTGSKIGEIINH